jgi:hypothetical protein
MRLDRLIVRLDQGRLDRLLGAVVDQLDSGLTREDLTEFSSRVAGLADGDDALLEPIVEFGDSRAPLVVDVFRTEGPELEAVFMAPAGLIDLVHDTAKSHGSSTRLRLLRSSAEWLDQ